MPAQISTSTQGNPGSDGHGGTPGRLVIRYREHGPVGVASGRRGRPGNRKLDEGLVLSALTSIHERHADFARRRPVRCSRNAADSRLPVPCHPLLCSGLD